MCAGELEVVAERYKIYPSLIQPTKPGKGRPKKVNKDPVKKIKEATKRRAPIPPGAAPIRPHRPPPSPPGPPVVDYESSCDTPDDSSASSSSKSSRSDSKYQK